MRIAQQYYLKTLNRSQWRLAAYIKSIQPNKERIKTVKNEILFDLQMCYNKYLMEYANYFGSLKPGKSWVNSILLG